MQLLSLGQHALQAAAALHDADVLDSNALQEMHGAFEVADHLSDANLLRTTQQLDPAANADAVGVAARITGTGSAVAVDVVPVDEELLIAERVRDALPVAAPVEPDLARSGS